MTDRTNEIADLPKTRMIFMGDAALTDGFQLIGFQTWADPHLEQMERVLEELIDSKANAFLVLDSHLAESQSEVLSRARAEGGRIVITEVPPLKEPDTFYHEIDDQIQSLLGGQTLQA